MQNFENDIDESIEEAFDNISVLRSEMLTAGLNRKLADANLDVIKTNMSTAQAKTFNREEQSRQKCKVGQSVNYLYNIASHLSLHITKPSSCRTQEDRAGDHAGTPLSRGTLILEKAQKGICRAPHR